MDLLINPALRAPGTHRRAARVGDRPENASGMNETRRTGNTKPAIVLSPLDGHAWPRKRRNLRDLLRK
jgi:hypothetical protein